MVISFVDIFLLSWKEKKHTTCLLSIFYCQMKRNVPKHDKFNEIEYYYWSLNQGFFSRFTLLPLRFAQVRFFLSLEQVVILSQRLASQLHLEWRKEKVSLELTQPLFITISKHSPSILMLPGVSKHSSKQIYYILKITKSWKGMDL